MLAAVMALDRLERRQYPLEFAQRKSFQAQGKGGVESWLIGSCHCERSEAIPLNQIASSALPPRNDKLHQSSIRRYQ